MGTLNQTNPEENSHSMQMIRCIMSDLEIRALYDEAVTELSPPQNAIEQVHDSRGLQVLQFFEYVAFYYGLVWMGGIFAITMLANALHMPHAVSMALSLIWGILTISVRKPFYNWFDTWSQTHATGIVSWIWQTIAISKTNKIEKQKKGKDAFTSDVNAIDKITTYLASKPIKKAEAVLRDIEAQLGRNQAAIPDLESIVKDFQKEKKGESAIDVLIDNKIDMGKMALTKLADQCKALAAQKKEVEGAIAPVKALVGRLTSISNVESRWNKLQSALSLVDENEHSIQSNSIAISSVKETCEEALSRLNNITETVKAFDHALVEVLQGA